MDPNEWAEPSEYDDLEAAPIFDDNLSPDHRSGYVVVIGRPNVGKSTLVNHFLGQKIAITSPKPQTTRNQILGILTIPSSVDPKPIAECPPAQVIFVDTPGIHQPHHKFGEYLTHTAVEAIPDADIVVWLVDATEPPTPEDKLVAEALVDTRYQAQKRGYPVIPTILAVNKIDLLSPDQLTNVERPFLELYPAEDWLPLSATQGDNRTELLRRIINLLPPGPRYFPDDQVTDQQTRFIVSELIREAALKTLHQEVPHALAVQVTEFTHRHDNLTYIGADVILERDSQKKIVIGQQGKTLKRIGQQARPQIEDLIETEVYLELWVKVRPKWRKKENELRWLGYAKS